MAWSLVVHGDIALSINTIQYNSCVLSTLSVCSTILCYALVLYVHLIHDIVLTSCPSYISETVRYRKLILVRDIGSGV